MEEKLNQGEFPTPESGDVGDSTDKTRLCRQLSDQMMDESRSKNGVRMCQVRTDMAVESVTDAGETPKGTKVHQETPEDGIRLTKVVIMEPQAAESLGKPMGTYLTVDIETTDIDSEPRCYDACVDVCTQCLQELCGDLDEDKTIMILGLGNRYVTADSLGTKVTEQVLVTRHMWGVVPEEMTRGIRSMCAIAPGVMGITGIETAETVRGIVDTVKPGLVVVIDALASRSIERLGRSVQFTDSGIVPGSGVGNRRMELSRKTLGVPVIAVGVPTVVDAATLASEAVELTISSLKEKMEEHSSKERELFGLLDDLNSHQKQLLFREVLYPRIGDMVVTPKDVDALIEKMSAVISASINMAFHGVNTRKQAEEYLWTNVE